MAEEFSHAPKPPPRLKPLRVPRQAWAEETTVEISTPPSSEGLLSPPNEGIRIAQPNESASIEVRQISLFVVSCKTKEFSERLKLQTLKICVKPSKICI